MLVEQYIKEINIKYQSGIATEHTFRGSLQQLIESIDPTVSATNEPKRQACGAPDYVLTRKDIPVGYIEAKDVGGADLEGNKINKNQFDRYRASLNNLIFTDYLDFHFYKDGVLTTTIKLAEIQEGKVKPLHTNFEQFTALIQSFTTYVGQTIKSSSKLSKMMAGKAKLLAQVIEKALTSDEENQANSTLKEQMNAFKQILIHDITPKAFSDIYAQTIVYGMFAARYHDPTPEDFSRQEAASLIPKSNPFLRKLFQYISGYDLDTRIEWIVTDLADIYRATNLKELMSTHGQSTQMNDPIIHFYEDFLAEYDPKLRKAKGVWYTPQPVVNFIVRAVDDILKTEFNLPKGLADSSKTKVKVSIPTHDKRYKGGQRDYEKEVHKVQILDPATGTGTFLAETIKHIYEKNFKAMQGAWSGYVENDLIPRLNGFELLMASYSMAHLKLDMLLSETGFKPKKEQRFRIYLTNSLEESHPDTGTLFASWLSSEANEANHIKRDTPVMCVIGNPPYAVSSTNKNPWIENLIADYKKNLNEKSYNSLSDDYVKFIRYGQHFVDKNGSGILAYISNNSFVDGLVFRQMRKNLLESFDKIYILDLHGNTKKKEVCTDGSQDQNVFDIMQGVSINIFVKKGAKTKGKLGKVHHYDLYGKRDFKYDFLKNNSIKDIEWSELINKEPHFTFIPKDFKTEEEYHKGVSINKLFGTTGSGIKFRKDNLLVKSHFNSNSVIEMLSDIEFLNDAEFLNKYQFNETSDWKLSEQRVNFNNPDYKDIKEVNYRPFDKRYAYYPIERINKIIPRGDSRRGLMKHFIKGDNLALITTKLNRGLSTGYNYISKNILDLHLLDSAGDSLQTFPLYLYPETNEQQTIGQSTERKPNLNTEIINQISENLGFTFTNEKETTENTFAPIDILDYIYAVLHSPTYREKYKEFLKIDFPRVPYPEGVNNFWQLVTLGGEIRETHLMESSNSENYITTYPIDGDNIITRKLTKTSIGFELTDKENSLGRVWINEEQYFDLVPLVAWEFYIGGYQPAQKWLKDRKGRELSYDDIIHYQKIIVALNDTHRIMKQIDEVIQL